MQFRITQLRFRFEAQDAVFFPAGGAGNVWRGALGFVLPESRFRPRMDSGPSGLSDAPRPFVLRVAHLDQVHIRAGEQVVASVNVFHHEAVSVIRDAMREVGEHGIGPGRGRLSLLDFEQTDVSVALDARPTVRRVAVRFVTPTELKSGETIAARPDFPVLLARVRDRVSTLRGLYGEGALALDFREFGERAAAVTMPYCDVRRVEAERRSSRTGQWHSLGGFVGEAHYEGDLGEFVPFLEAAVWTGVGRQTVWGKGEIAVDFRPEP